MLPYPFGPKPRVKVIGRFESSTIIDRYGEDENIIFCGQRSSRDYHGPYSYGRVRRREEVCRIVDAALRKAGK